MPKGKKYTAAEKHFENKRIQYEKRISQLQNEKYDIQKQLYKLNQEKLQLEADNRQLKEWIERLLTYTELSLDDIKKVCEKEKNANSIFENIPQIAKLFMGYMR